MGKQSKGVWITDTNGRVYSGQEIEEPAIGVSVGLSKP